MDAVNYSKQLNRYKKTDSISIQMVPLLKRKKSDRWFYKRKRYLILFCVLCFFFLYYQIISFIRLSWDVSEDVESAYLSKNNKPTKDELDFIKDQVSVYMPGVREEHSKNYIKTSEHFKCLHSGEIIMFNQINDHFCDCKDGTDEPSTSACPNNKFYCVKHSSTGKQFISSSRVNDGICDCCEGSDEWLNVTSHKNFDTEQMDLMRKKSNIMLTPCKNYCNDNHDNHHT